MCTTIGIINKGHLVLKGTIDEIHRAAAMSSPLVLTIAEEDIDKTFEILQENQYVQKVTAQGNILNIVFTGSSDDESELLAEIIKSGIQVKGFHRQEGSLESLFMQVVNGNK